MGNFSSPLNRLNEATTADQQTLQEPLQDHAAWKRIAQEREQVRWKRLIERNKPLFQSDWFVNVRCIEREDDIETLWAKRALLFRDWFDYILSIRTSLLILFICFCYTLIIIFWALIYMSIECEETGPRLGFHEAFAFSVETATTVSQMPFLCWM